MGIWRRIRRWGRGDMEIPDNTSKLNLHGCRVGPGNLAQIATQLELYGAVYAHGASTEPLPGMACLLLGTTLESVRHIRTRIELWMGVDWMQTRLHLELGDLFDQFLEEMQRQKTLIPAHSDVPVEG